MNENIETRVGRTSLSVLRDLFLGYIKVYTVSGVYKGDLDILEKYNSLNLLLETGEFVGF